MTVRMGMSTPARRILAAQREELGGAIAELKAQAERIAKEEVVDRRDAQPSRQVPEPLAYRLRSVGMPQFILQRLRNQEVQLSESWKNFTSSDRLEKRTLGSSERGQIAATETFHRKLRRLLEATDC
jgi:hypothetical protein